MLSETLLSATRKLLALRLAIVYTDCSRCPATAAARSRKSKGPSMGTLLLNHGYVITVDAERRVIPDGWITGEGDMISGLGSMADAPLDHDGDTVLDLRGMVVVPGFINGHNHHWGSLFKNTGEGLLLEPWLDKITLPLAAVLTDADQRIAAYLGAIEQLRTGTTCSLNHVVTVNEQDSMRAIIEPVLEVGIRQLVAKELRDTPDPPFSTRYEARPHIRSRDEELALAAEVARQWRADPHGIRHGDRRELDASQRDIGRVDRRGGCACEEARRQDQQSLLSRHALVVDRRIR